MAVPRKSEKYAVQDVDRPEKSGTGEDEEASEVEESVEDSGESTLKPRILDEMSEGNAVAEEKVLIGAVSGEHESDEFEEDSELDDLKSDSEDEDFDLEALDRIQNAAVSGLQKKRRRVVETLDVSSKEDPLMVGPGKKKATVSALLDALEGSADLGDSVQRELKKLSEAGGLEPNLDKIQSQRIERDVAYGRTTEIVSRPCSRAALKHTRGEPLMRPF